MFRSALLFAVFATPTFAQDVVSYDACDELWFMRNQIYANAGYCFSSPLGQVMFDNTNCTGTEVTLSSFEQALVDEYRALERSAGCAVDTSQTEPLSVYNLENRRAEPWLGGENSFTMCVGWTGAAFPIYADPDPSATRLGEVVAGDNLSVIVQTDGPGGAWFYYYVMDESELRLEGWADRDIDYDLCTSNAG